MANTAFTTTEADQFLLDLWADEIEQTRNRELVFARIFADAKVAYPAVNRARGFQNLFITATTALNSGTARSKTEGNDNTLTYDVNTDTKVTLAIDQWKYQAQEVEDFADALSGFDIMEAYMHEIGEAIARDEDTHLAGFPDNFSNPVGALANENSEDELLEAIQTLGDNDVPANRAWAFSEKGYARLFAQVKYTSMDFSGDKPIESGTLPSLYGYPVFHSANVEGSNAAGHDNTICHPKAVAYYRVGNAPRVRPVMAEDNLADKVSVSNIYGAIEVRDDHGIFVRGA